MSSKNFQTPSSARPAGQTAARPASQNPSSARPASPQNQKSTALGTARPAGQTARPAGQTTARPARRTLKYTFFAFLAVTSLTAAFLLGAQTQAGNSTTGVLPITKGGTGISNFAIADNLTTTAAGSVLSANQGKALNDGKQAKLSTDQLNAVNSGIVKADVDESRGYVISGLDVANYEISPSDLGISNFGGRLISISVHTKTNGYIYSAIGVWSSNEGTSSWQAMTYTAKISIVKEGNNINLLTDELKF
jgi:hypothetical protein